MQIIVRNCSIHLPFFPSLPRRGYGRLKSLGNEDCWLLFFSSCIMWVTSLLVKRSFTLVRSQRGQTVWKVIISDGQFGKCGCCGEKVAPMLAIHKRRQVDEKICDKDSPLKILENTYYKVWEIGNEMNSVCLNSLGGHLKHWRMVVLIRDRGDNTLKWSDFLLSFNNSFHTFDRPTTQLSLTPRGDHHVHTYFGIDNSALPVNTSRYSSTKRSHRCSFFTAGSHIIAWPEPNNFCHIQRSNGRASGCAGRRRNRTVNSRTECKRKVPMDGDYHIDIHPGKAASLFNQVHRENSSRNNIVEGNEIAAGVYMVVRNPSS